MDLDGILNDAGFASPVAVDAYYTPRIGTGSAVRVVVSDPSDLTPDFAGGAVYASGVVIDVSATDVAAPEAGDTITVEGRVRTIVGDPRKVSGCWRLNAR